MGIAAAASVAGILAFLALRPHAPAPDLAAAQPAESAGAAETLPAAATTAPAAAKPVPPPADPLAAAAQQIAAKPGKATPFTNGPVGAKPSVIKIKMDGAIEGIQGASQPTGFTVVVPNRKSVEPTESLGSKDPRIAAIRVANEAEGAEFSVSFKDGVPNYLVRAHGDVLEMVLAKESAHGDKAEANANANAKKKHHGKKH
jgi:hypothetical protein